MLCATARPSGAAPRRQSCDARAAGARLPRRAASARPPCCRRRTPSTSCAAAQGDGDGAQAPRQVASVRAFGGVTQLDGARENLLGSLDRQEGVEAAIEELRELNPTEAPAESPLLTGKWRLRWSTQADNANFFQKLFSGLAENYQIIDGEAMQLENRVRLGPFTVSAKADCQCVSAVRTEVKIRSVTVSLGEGDSNADGDAREAAGGWLSRTFTLDNAQGWVEQLYLDDKVRISIGNKGSTFVHTREDESATSARDGAAAAGDTSAKEEAAIVIQKSSNS